WAEGRNLHIDHRWAGGDADRVRKYATELVALAPDGILSEGSPTVGPLLQATRTIPIVFGTRLTAVPSPPPPGRQACISSPFSTSIPSPPCSAGLRPPRARRPPTICRTSRPAESTCCSAT